MRRRAPALAAVTLLLAGACASEGTEPVPLADRGTSPSVDAATALADLVVHRSPDCPCCGGWQEVMRAAGFSVVEEHHEDMASVKDDHQVPDDQRSCHTTTVDGYVVEGHVPVDALVDLLEQRPAVDGIALAGMPAGSPGMPGEKTGPLVVTTIVDGEVVGELGRY